MSTNSSRARSMTSWRSRNCPHARSLRVTLCPPRGLALLGAAQRCGPCPHARPVRVTLCPPRGPLCLRPGEAGSAAPACMSRPYGLLLRVASHVCSPVSEPRPSSHCHRHGWQWPVGDETVFASHRWSQKGGRFASALRSCLRGAWCQGVDSFRVFIGKLEPAF